jgi:hypothetical protein
MIQLTCCGETYHADEAHLGREIECRKCGRRIRIAASSRVIEMESFAKGQAAHSTSSFSSHHQPARRAHKFRFAPAAIAAVGLIVCLAIPIAIMRRPELASISGDHPSLDDQARSDPHPSERATEPDRSAMSSGQSITTTDSSKKTSSGTRPRSLDPSRTVAEPQALRPITGHSIEPPSHYTSGGHCELNIDNNSGWDAVVKLVTQISTKTVWKKYLRAGDSLNVTGVESGSYRLRFALGSAWDPNEKRFLREPQYFEMDKILTFEEDSEKATVVDATLKEVAHGNVPRVSIDSASFNEGDE